MKLRRFCTLFLTLVLLLTATPAFEMTAYAAEMPYYITVDLANQIVTIFSTQTHEIVRQMLCSSGVDNTTPVGTFTLPKNSRYYERKEWYFFSAYNVWAQYATRIRGGIMFHSIPCNRKSQSYISKLAVSQFGTPASHGCIRLRWKDARFIAQNCLKGTKVQIYKNGDRDEDLRELLMQSSYTNEDGMTYNQFLGLPEQDGVLGRYSVGPEVRDLQFRLRDLGFFDGTATGEYRVDTVNAVRQVQRALGMETTGVATEAFQEAVYAADAPTSLNVTLEEGASGPVVRNLQQYLTELGLYEGALDGAYDVDVAASVKAFQDVYGYATDGIATPEVLKAIYYEAGKLQAMFSQSAGYTSELLTDKLNMGRIESQVGIRIREKPTTKSEALGRLVDGNFVLGLERGDTWSKIQYGDCVGYIKNIYVNYFQKDITLLQYKATDGDLVHTIGHTADEYYAGASLPAEVFSEYLASDGSLEDYDGLSTFATVNTAGSDVSLNLRQGPSTNSEILAELSYGTQAKVLLRSTEWSLVDYNGMNGYLLNEYLEFWIASEDTLDEEIDDVSEEEFDDEVLYGVVRSAAGKKAPVYDLDSEDAALLGHLDNGVTVEVLRTVGGWSNIRYKGHTGYMKDEDLQFFEDLEMVA